MSDIRERCAGVMARVMEIDAADVSGATSPDNLDQWDSLTHVQLVLQLEQEFGIKISPEEGIEHFTDFKSILDYIGNKAG